MGNILQEIMALIVNIVGLINIINNNGVYKY